MNGNQFGYEQGNISFEPVNLQPPGHAKGYAIASLALGIASLVCVCCCCGALFFVGIPAGILAIVFAVLSRRDQGGKFSGMAIAGLILGIIGLILCLICCVLYIQFNAMLNDPEAMRAFLEELEQMYRDAGIDVDLSDIYSQLE